MATTRQSAILPGLAGRPASVEEDGQMTNRRAGPLLLVGGTAYAAAYVVIGFTGLSWWVGLLGIGGTALVVLGIKLAAFRSS